VDDAPARRARRRGVVLSFHTNHRLLVAFAFLGYAILTYLIAIGPALQVQNTSPLPGAHARSPEEALGHERYLAEGCGFCHTQFVRDLPMDRPYGRASLPRTTRSRIRRCSGRSAPARICRTSVRDSRATLGTCSICSIRASSCRSR